jgi:hypothetical protein
MYFDTSLNTFRVDLSALSSRSRCHGLGTFFSPPKDFFWTREEGDGGHGTDYHGCHGTDYHGCVKNPKDLNTSFHVKFVVVIEIKTNIFIETPIHV